MSSLPSSPSTHIVTNTICPVSNKEMNILEREFLWLIGFELHITATHYERIFREVVLQNDRLPSILR